MGSGELTRCYDVVMSAARDSLLYARVETVLAGEIADGNLKIGEQLATEDSLIARFGVSRITVRRAIQNHLFWTHSVKT
jgi:GntR family transcriptional regulator